VADSTKWEKIGGVDSYVATPAGEYLKDKMVLMRSVLGTGACVCLGETGNTCYLSDWLTTSQLMVSRLAITFIPFRR
jgi:hypothetical protein